MDKHISNIRNELFLLEKAFKKNSLSTYTKEPSKSMAVKASKKKDLHKYTSAQLKEFLKKNKIKNSNSKKDDLVNAVWKFMNQESDSSDESESSDESDSSDSD